MPRGKKEEKTKQLTIRIPEKLHRALKVKTAREGTSMGGVIEKLIETYVGGKNKSRKRGGS